MIHAVTRTGQSAAATADLHERVRAPVAGTRYIFVVDSSGSHAIHERMRLVKGAIGGLMETANGRHDEIVVIACRGAAASVLVEPTSAHDQVERALEYLPTGGRTPLAHAMELAATFVTDAAVVILVTDGRANVPSQTDDAWADAQAAAAAIRCRALVIDSEAGALATGKPRELAAAMRATHVRLDELDQTSMLRVIREAS